MPIRIVADLSTNLTQIVEDLRPGDAFLFLAQTPLGYTPHPETDLNIGEPFSLMREPMTHDPDTWYYDTPWLSYVDKREYESGGQEVLCLWPIHDFAAGQHTVTFGSSYTILFAKLIRGLDPTNWGFRGRRDTSLDENILYGSRGFYADGIQSYNEDFGESISTGRTSALVYTYMGALCNLPDGIQRLDDSQHSDYGAEVARTTTPPWDDPDLHLLKVLSSSTFTLQPPSVSNQSSQAGLLVYASPFFFLGTDDEPGAGEDGIDAARVTQAGAYIESAEVSGASEDGIDATRITQAGAYIESAGGDGGAGEDGINATRITQAGAYIESAEVSGTGEDGPNAARITQSGAYIESAETGTDGVNSVSVTQIGVYLEVTQDEGAEAERISQAFVLVELRREPPYKTRVSQAFVLVEGRRVTHQQLPPSAGDISGPPPPTWVPADPMPSAWKMPATEIPSISLPAAPDRAAPSRPPPAPPLQPPAPLRPVKWISTPDAPSIAMPPLPQGEPAQPSYLPYASQTNVLAITEARVARSMLAGALTATFDAQSTPIKGTALGPNLALVNSVPAQTTESSPIAGRRSTYTNIGRAAKAIYAPEVQTPGATKVNSATDATPTIASDPISPTVRINVIYPLLGSSSLSGDITIALDASGYEQAIGALLDAILQPTVTIGYEEGESPDTIDLYVMPGTIDAATLDGLTVADLLLIGSADGQFLRYNESAAQWQPSSEPLNLKGLNPSTDEAPDQHGGFRYNPLTKHLEMLVEVT